MEIAVGTRTCWTGLCGTDTEYDITLDVRIDFCGEIGGIACDGTVECILEIKGLKQRLFIGPLVAKIEEADEGLDKEAAERAIEWAIENALTEHGGSFFDNERKVKEAFEMASRKYALVAEEDDLVK